MHYKKLHKFNNNTIKYGIFSKFNSIYLNIYSQVLNIVFVYFYAIGY